MADAVVTGWQARIRAAVAARKPLRLRGGGTKDFYGQALEGDVLDTTSYAGILDYDPTELVITVRTGTQLAHVERTMRECGQMLACEPPRYGEQATIGGLVATGLSGPRRPYAGAVRDLVLGVRIVDGKGDELAFGGRVMKNVAGFDVSRLMTGALGTLGLITEVSLKCVPCPKAETTRVFECAADEAIRLTNEWAGKPLPVTATAYHAGRLAVRLSGAPPAVEAAVQKIGGKALPGNDRGGAFWRSVREQTQPFFVGAQESGAPLWRIAVKSTAPFTDLGGEQLIEWGGALRWLAANERADAARVRAWAASHGGHATLYRAADKTPGAFHPLPETLHALHRRLKTTFDPAGVLNPRRLYADF
ncbi:MAG TPA: glycolate oxidase subunit GlcE [Casimicrobiaceae bacterium]